MTKKSEQDIPKNSMEEERKWIIEEFLEDWNEVCKWAESELFLGSETIIRLKRKRRKWKKRLEND